jgi:hypothetical protein
LASKAGWSAFEEGVAGFLDVVWGTPCAQESERLMPQLLFERCFHALLQGTSCRLHGYGRPGSNGLGQRDGFLQQFVGWYQTI